MTPAQFSKIKIHPSQRGPDIEWKKHIVDKFINVTNHAKYARMVNTLLWIMHSFRPTKCLPSQIYLTSSLANVTPDDPPVATLAYFGPGLVGPQFQVDGEGCAEIPVGTEGKMDRYSLNLLMEHIPKRYERLLSPSG